MNPVIMDCFCVRLTFINGDFDNIFVVSCPNRLLGFEAVLPLCRKRLIFLQTSQGLQCLFSGMCVQRVNAQGKWQGGGRCFQALDNGKISRFTGTDIPFFVRQSDCKAVGFACVQKYWNHLSIPLHFDLSA